MDPDPDGWAPPPEIADHSVDVTVHGERRLCQECGEERAVTQHRVHRNRPDETVLVCGHTEQEG